MNSQNMFWSIFNYFSNLWPSHFLSHVPAKNFQDSFRNFKRNTVFRIQFFDRHFYISRSFFKQISNILSESKLLNFYEWKGREYGKIYHIKYVILYEYSWIKNFIVFSCKNVESLSWYLKISTSESYLPLFLVKKRKQISQSAAFLSQMFGQVNAKLPRKTTNSQISIIPTPYYRFNSTDSWEISLDRK